MSAFGEKKKSLLSLSVPSVLLEQQSSTCRCAGGRLALQRKPPASPWVYCLLTFLFSGKCKASYRATKYNHSLWLRGKGHPYLQSPGSSGPPQGIQFTHSARETPISHICKGPEIASFSRALRALCSLNTQNPVLAVQPAITDKPKIAPRPCQHHSSPRHVPSLSPPGCGDGRQRTLSSPGTPSPLPRHAWSHTTPHTLPK